MKSQPPVYRHRGVYLESSYGPDLMELRDWYQMIDYFAGLDLNVLGVGLYGCWSGFLQGQRPECLMVSFPGRPRLQTPKTFRYASPRAKGYRTLSYLPRMFEQDFLPQVLAYARRRGITAFPVLSSLGHNTLIPREYPEVSSRNAQGRPNHYGYCTRSRQTYDLLFDLYGSLIDRYLKPQGVTWFGIGLDEVVPVAGIDPEDPERVIDPWCQCPACSRQSRPKRFLDFIVRLAHFLVDKGMERVLVYHDQLEAFGMFRPSLERRLEREGLKDRVLFGFWDYEDRGPGVVVNLHPELGIERWVTPMTCCFTWVSYQSKVDNIWGLLARGQKARATGVMSYSFFDWAYAEHFYHLSRAAKETGRICRAQVDLEFARRIFGRSWREGTTALRLLNDYGLLVGGICGAEGYQPDKGTLGKCVVQNRQRLHMMERMLAWADQAHSLLRPLAQGPATGLAGRVRRSLWAEAVRTRNLLEEFVILARAYPKRPSRPELQHCLRLHREIAEAIEQNKPHYVIPMDMVYLTPMQEYLEDACSV